MMTVLATSNLLSQMVSYVAYIIRGFGEQAESFGERLILSALRLLQDLPANSIQARKASTVVFSAVAYLDIVIGPHGCFKTPHWHPTSQSAVAPHRQALR